GVRRPFFVIAALQVPPPNRSGIHLAHMPTAGCNDATTISKHHKSVNRTILFEAAEHAPLGQSPHKQLAFFRADDQIALVRSKRRGVEFVSMRIDAARQMQLIFGLPSGLRPAGRAEADCKEKREKEWATRFHLRPPFAD